MTGTHPNDMALDPGERGLRLDFSRYEFKYVLPLPLRNEVEQVLQNFLEYDPFVRDIPEHRYFVRSLYFDDPFHSAFHDKIDGLHTRSKYRIRTYTPTPDRGVPQFLEEKGRVNNRVFKHRTPLDPLFIETGSTQEVIDALRASRSDDPLVQRFSYHMARKQLGPVALVDYVRRPYISHYDPDFRVTFDEQLAGTDTHELFPLPSARRRQAVPGFTIMEVKFGHHLPAWFHRIIQSYELKRVSISKICECMTTLGLARDLS